MKIGMDFFILEKELSLYRDNRHSISRHSIFRFNLFTSMFISENLDDYEKYRGMLFILE